MWWREAQEIRALYEFHQPRLDADTLKRIHWMTERERLGLHPIPWHQRVLAACLKSLRRLFQF